MTNDKKERGGERNPNFPDLQLSTFRVRHSIFNSDFVLSYVHCLHRSTAIINSRIGMSFEEWKPPRRLITPRANENSQSRALRLSFGVFRIDRARGIDPQPAAGAGKENASKHGEHGLPTACDRNHCRHE